MLSDTHPLFFGLADMRQNALQFLQPELDRVPTLALCRSVRGQGAALTFLPERCAIVHILVIAAVFRRRSAAARALFVRGFGPIAASSGGRMRVLAAQVVDRMKFIRVPGSGAEGSVERRLR